jgi:tyrosine-protein kinase Etk/Wzc
MGLDEVDRGDAVGSCTSTPKQEVDDSIDLWEMFRDLLRGKRVILLASLGTALLATLISFTPFLVPIRYTSTTSFIPPNNAGNGASMASLVAGQLSSIGAGDLLGTVKNSGEVYAGILRSHSIAARLIERFDLMREYGVKKESLAEKKLAAYTDITVDPKSTIVTLDVTASRPQLAHDLASAYMDALRETNGRLALSQSSQRRLFFEQQLVKEKNDLEDAEVELKKTEEQSGLIAPTGQTESEIGVIAQTQAQIAVREVELAALRDSATEQNPDVIRLRSEIGDLQGQLARLQKGAPSKSSATIPTSKVPELQLEYVRKEREVKYHEALFDMLSRQYEAARLDEARDSPLLQVLDAATYPDTKSWPKRLYFLLGGLVLGFVGSSIWVIARGRVSAVRVYFALNEIA